MSKLVFRLHALQRMYSRQISELDVRFAIENGEVIEDYKDDLPYPSKLLSCRVGIKHLHIVVSLNNSDHETIVITAYEPDPHLWENNFKKRRFK